MISYKTLVESLPAKNVVLALGEFNPPSARHQILARATRRLAESRKSDYMICVGAGGLDQARKMHYVEMALPGMHIMDVGSIPTDILLERFMSRYDKVSLANRLCEHVIPLDDGANSSHQMRGFAAEGNFGAFKRCAPYGMREVDVRRMMNDIREDMGYEAIMDRVVLPVDGVRERYFRGEIYNVGDLVESGGQQFEIVKRGTNHLVCKDSSNTITTKGLHEVTVNG